jgi:hypothetical protein
MSDLYLADMERASRRFGFSAAKRLCPAQPARSRAVLKAHDPHGYLDKDRDLQKAIADKLIASADSGVTNPQELRRRTLENVDFKPPH